MSSLASYASLQEESSGRLPSGIDAIDGECDVFRVANANSGGEICEKLWAPRIGEGEVLLILHSEEDISGEVAVGKFGGVEGRCCPGLFCRECSSM